MWGKREGCSGAEGSDEDKRRRVELQVRSPLPLSLSHLRFPLEQAV